MATRSNSSLVVGRDRQHVKALAAEYPTSEVISASAFFDRVRMLAFCDDEKIIRDDHAPLIFAERILSNHEQYHRRMAKKFASLYSACYHGTSAPLTVLDMLGSGPHDFRAAIAVVADIDRAMNRRHLVNGVSALFAAWQIMAHKKIAPFSLYGHEIIELHHLVDLTLLEIEVIKDLSRLGLRFDIRFPLDFQKRGINVAVDFSARQFESAPDITNIELVFDNLAPEGPLENLVSKLFIEDENVELSGANCSISLAPNLIAEATELASQVAHVLTETPHEKVAVAVRKIDHRSEIFKRALMRQGISVRDRKGIPLVSSPAGLLLESLFSARLWSFPKKELINLINHQGFSLAMSDIAQRTRLVSLMELLGIDDHVLSSASLKDRLREPFKRLENTLGTDDERREDAKALQDWLDRVDEMLNLLAPTANFKDYLCAVSTLLGQALAGDDESNRWLADAISVLGASRALASDAEQMPLGDFYLVLKSELANITVPRPDYLDANAVELVLLPELLGRRFDHVFIADISFGRMPANSEPDAILNDQARLALNKLLGKPFLRVFLDDPFEPLPVPPRQALEPFWFASAVASAKTSVHFSCARADETGQEQAPSEFFTWLSEHVTCLETMYHRRDFHRPEYHRFLAGMADAAKAADEHIPYARIMSARKQSFLDGTAHEFAFSFDKDSVIAAFEGCLLDQPTKALTPTMIEAFAGCRFKGFAEQKLGISRKNLLNDDVDARIVGSIAHRVLEKYFRHISSLPANSETGKSEPHDLRTTLDDVIRDFLENNYVPNQLVFECHMDWLFDALQTLIDRLVQIPAFAVGHGVAQELSMGLDRSKFPPLPIWANGHQYLLGGRVDCIRRVGNEFLILDYKLSSSATLKASQSSKNLLSTNFQAPVYLRLVARYFCKNDPSKVQFAFASIRDGEILQAISGNDTGYFERIFDDERPDGLAAAVDQIFRPVALGNVVATIDDHCERCDLSFVCRRREA